MCTGFSLKVKWVYLQKDPNGIKSDLYTMIKYILMG